jgi:hypothetical protein
VPATDHHACPAALRHPSEAAHIFLPVRTTQYVSLLSFSLDLSYAHICLYSVVTIAGHHTLKPVCWPAVVSKRSYLRCKTDQIAITQQVSTCPAAREDIVFSLALAFASFIMHRLIVFIGSLSKCKSQV